MTGIITIIGKVIKGKSRGKALGFPTANIKLHKNIPEGVYASLVKIGGKTCTAATFIGSPKTFGEKDYKAESFIFDFIEDIYGRRITVTLLKKIRPNRKFTSVDELTAQIRKDVLVIRKFFG